MTEKVVIEANIAYGSVGVGKGAVSEFYQVFRFSELYAIKLFHSSMFWVYAKFHHLVRYQISNICVALFENQTRGNFAIDKIEIDGLCWWQLAVWYSNVVRVHETLWKNFSHLKCFNKMNWKFKKTDKKWTNIFRTISRQNLIISRLLHSWYRVDIVRWCFLAYLQFTEKQIYIKTFHFIS